MYKTTIENMTMTATTPQTIRMTFLVLLSNNIRVTVLYVVHFGYGNEEDRAVGEAGPAVVSDGTFGTHRSVFGNEHMASVLKDERCSC